MGESTAHGGRVQDLGWGRKDHGPRGGSMEAVTELEEPATCGSLLKKEQEID